MSRKPSLGSLLLAGAAAYGLYRASKMTPQQRNDLVNKGKKFVNDNLGNLKNNFSRNGSTPTARQGDYVNDVNYGG